MKRKIHRGAPLTITAGLVLLGSSCSLFTIGDVEQCQVDADCTARGAAFAGTKCEAQVCVMPNTTSGQGGDTVVACQSNTECIQKNNGELFHCIEGSCVGLLSEDCIEVFPKDAWKADNAIVFGFGGPFEGAQAWQGTSNAITVRMALDEIQENAVGIPMETGKSRSPFMAVICDTTNDPLRAFSHLVDKLKVQAVVCGDVEEGCLSVTQQVTIPSGHTLMLSPWASVPWGDLEKDGRVISFRTSHQKVATMYTNMLQAFENDVRAALGLAPTEKVRMALIHDTNKANTTFMTEVEPNLYINGQSAVSQLNTNYKRYANDASNPQPIIDDIVGSFHPHMILKSWVFDPGSNIFKPIEAAWPQDVEKPHWLILLRETTMVNAIADVPEAAPRVRGLWYENPNKDLAASFASRYQTFSEGLQAVQNNDQIYDAVNMLAFSYALGRNAPVLDGKQLAAGIYAQNAGFVVDFYGSHAGSAMNTILGKGEIDANGVFGTLDFDPAQGVMLGHYEAYCFTDPRGDGVWEQTHANQRYSLFSDHAVTGEFCCPFEPTDCQ